MTGNKGRNGEKWIDGHFLDTSPSTHKGHRGLGGEGRNAMMGNKKKDFSTESIRHQAGLRGACPVGVPDLIGANEISESRVMSVSVISSLSRDLRKEVRFLHSASLRSPT